MGFSRYAVVVVARGYAAVACAVACVTLALPAPGVVRSLALALLAPVALLAVCRAVQTASAAVEAWRDRRLGASIRRALKPVARSHRIVRQARAATREDHLVVGPNGVFVVVASDERGGAFIGARAMWRGLVEESRVQALEIGERLRRELGRSLPVHPLVCCTRALLSVGREVSGVRLVHLSHLARAVVGTPTATPLRAAEVAEVANLFRSGADVVPLRARRSRVAGAVTPA